MADKFILVRKTKSGNQDDKRPHIRVSKENYDTLVEWSALTGKSITEVASRALSFAAAHLEIVDE